MKVETDFYTIVLFEIPKLFRTKMPIDVVLVQVSKPDDFGYVSLGISVDYTKSACENAKIVIAQVNKYMPRTMGESFIHISDIDYIVEYDEPIYTLPRPNIGDVEMKIGKYCSTLIEDGDTLQLGIGGNTGCSFKLLDDKKI